jgi:transcriptional regulator with XRE-family HTH domain
LRAVKEQGGAGAPYARVPLDTGRLRTLRLNKGWSQHALSVEVGVQGAAAVSAWERGAATPRPSTLLRVAEVLGVHAVELLAVDREQGLTIRELRVSRGMSLQELAKAVNASSSTVRRWENGDFQGGPNQDVVGALARALGVPPEQARSGLVRARSRAKQRDVSMIAK